MKFEKHINQARSLEAPTHYDHEATQVALDGLEAQRTADMASADQQAAELRQKHIGTI